MLSLSALNARSLEHIKHAIFPCTFKILYPICSRPSYTTKIHAAECEHFSYLKLFGFSYETLLCNLVQPFGLFLLLRVYGLDHEKDQIICQVFVTVDHAGSRISFKGVLTPPLGSSFQMLYYSVIVIF